LALFSFTCHTSVSERGEGRKYFFDINENTLESDYTVWICSNARKYYLVETSFLVPIFNHRNARVNHHHEGHSKHVIFHLDTKLGEDRFYDYAEGEPPIDFRPYRQAVLPES
jgi:hypothetical protein